MGNPLKRKKIRKIEAVQKNSFVKKEEDRQTISVKNEEVKEEIKSAVFFEEVVQKEIELPELPILVEEAKENKVEEALKVSKKKQTKT